MTVTPVTRTLYPHQDEGAAFLARTPRAMLADDVGLGKTAQVAAAIDRLWLDHLADVGRPVLYLTAAALVGQTVRELHEWLPSRRVQSTKDGRLTNGSTDVWVMSHDMFHRRWQEMLGAQLLIVDEASALKGGAAKFGTIRSACDKAERVAVLTATPLENNPLVLWTLMQLVGGVDLGRHEDDFLDDFCKVRYYSADNIKVEGWRSPTHAARAMERIRPFFLRRTVDQVDLRLPTPEPLEPVLVPLTPDQQRRYARASRIPDGLRRVREQHKASRTSPDGSSPLLDKAVAIALDEVVAGGKVVMYTELLADVEGLVQRLRAAGIRCTEVRGAIGQNDRADAVEEFRSRADTPVLVGNKVLEYGLNLQFANTLISVGVSYNPAREWQREGRLRRIGSPHQTYRHWVVLPDIPLVEEQLATLRRKERTAEPILGKR